MLNSGQSFLFLPVLKKFSLSDYFIFTGGYAGTPAVMILLHRSGYTESDVVGVLILCQIVCGTFLNLTVLAVNNWRMPVKTDYSRRLGFGYQYMTAYTRMNWLCDRYLMPKWVPLIGQLRGIASIGDLMVFSGTALAYIFILFRLTVLIA